MIFLSLREKFWWWLLLIMEREMKHLSLVEEDEEGFTSNVHKDSKMFLWLVGRFLTEKTIWVQIMNVWRIWRLMNGVRITKVEQGTFIFQFFHKLDMKRIFLSGPCLFDNNVNSWESATSDVHNQILLLGSNSWLIGGVWFRRWVPI